MEAQPGKQQRPPSKKTPWWVWVLAVCGVMALSCALIAGGAVWWFSKNKDRLASEGNKAKAEAEAYAASHDQNDCLKEGLSRVDACGKLAMVCEGMAKAFTSTCIQKAQPVEGFCDGVPPMTEILQVSLWVVEACERRGRADDQQCHRLMQEVSEACHEKK